MLWFELVTVESNLILVTVESNLILKLSIGFHQWLVLTTNSAQKNIM